MTDWKSLALKIYNDNENFYYIGQYYRICAPIKIAPYSGFRIIDAVHPIENVNLETLKETNSENICGFLGADWWVFSYALRGVSKIYSVRTTTYIAGKVVKPAKLMDKCCIRYKTQDTWVDKTEKNILQFSWDNTKPEQAWSLIRAYCSNTEHKIKIEAGGLILDEIDLIERLKNKTHIRIFLHNEDYKAKKAMRVDLY